MGTYDPKLDRYDTEITLDDHRYRISFLPILQVIVFTNMDTNFGGQFNVAHGWIGSKKPADFLLENELKHYLTNPEPKVENHA